MSGNFINSNSLIYLKILFVHVDAVEVDLFKKAVYHENYQILSAASMNEAHNILLTENDATNPVDLLLTEYRLPNIDGFQLIRNAREIDTGIFCAILTKHNLQSVVNDVRASNLTIEGIIHKAEDISKLRYFLCSIFEEKKKRLQKHLIIE